MDNNLLELIKDIDRVEEDIQEGRKALNHHRKSKIYFQKLIDEGKFNKSSMEERIKLIGVEIRKYEDFVEKHRKQKERYQNILRQINER